MPQAKPKTCFDAEKFEFCHSAAVLQTQVPKLCTDLDLSLLYILISGTYSKFAWKNNFLAVGVCFLQPCSSEGRTPTGVYSRGVYARLTHTDYKNKILYSNK